VFAPRLSLTSCATLCRSMGTMLHSGVGLLKALSVLEKQQRTKTAQAAIRQISQDVRKGMDLASAFKEHGRYFPELMVDMIGVAEQTGKLPEVLSGLADHYENLVRLRRAFISAIAWPVLQLLAAIFIIAGLILVLGWIAQSQQGQERFDPLGFGLHGETGALIWLGYCFGSIGAGFVIYQFLIHGFRQAQAVHTFMLAIPVVGHCMRSFSVARFSWAYALTQQAGMDIQPSLEASLKATNNGAFAAATPQVVAAVMAGEDFTDAIQSTNLFPRQFLEMVRVGESTGTVPETLERLSPQFEEQARRALAALTVALGWVIWSLVAMMIIFLIFRVFGFYIDMINRAANGQL